MLNRRFISIFLVLLIAIFSMGCNSDTKTVVLEVNKELMKELSSPLYRDVIFLTNINYPITSLQDVGLKKDEIAIGLRRDESYDGFLRSPVKFRATTLSDKDVTEEAKQDALYGKILRILKLSNAKIYKQDSWTLTSPVDFLIFPEIAQSDPFHEHPPLKLLITHKEFEKVIVSKGGAIKIRFEGK